jgi:hypothetical protein
MAGCLLPLSTTKRAREALTASLAHSKTNLLTIKILWKKAIEGYALLYIQLDTPSVVVSAVSTVTMT